MYSPRNFSSIRVPPTLKILNLGEFRFPWKTVFVTLTTWKVNKCRRSFLALLCSIFDYPNLYECRSCVWASFVEVNRMKLMQIRVWQNSPKMFLQKISNSNNQIERYTDVAVEIQLTTNMLLNGAPDFHRHFTFWTKFWDQVWVSRTKSFLEIPMVVNLLLSNPT